MSKRQSLREFEAELRARGQRPAEPEKRQPLREFEAQLRRSNHVDWTPHRPMTKHRADTALTWSEVRAALTALEGSRVAVRLVESSQPEMLLAVMAGELGAATGSKHPALFWPMNGASAARDGQEIPGIYLHPGRFHGAVARAGASVLVITQGPVLINIRRI